MNTTRCQILCLFFRCCETSKECFSNLGFRHRHFSFRNAAFLASTVVLLLFSELSSTSNAGWSRTQFTNATNVDANGLFVGWNVALGVAWAGKHPLQRNVNGQNVFDWGPGQFVANNVTSWKTQPVVVANNQHLIVDAFRNERAPKAIGAQWLWGNAFLNPNGIAWGPIAFAAGRAANDPQKINVFAVNSTDSVIYYHGLSGYEAVPIEFDLAGMFWEERTRGSEVSLVADAEGSLQAGENRLIATLEMVGTPTYLTFGVFSGFSQDRDEHLFSAFSHTVPEPHSMNFFYFAILSVCAVFRRRLSAGALKGVLVHRQMESSARG